MIVKNEKGFTFIEAIVSLNVLMIFCTLIVPSFTVLQQRKENLITSSVAEDLLTDDVHLYYLDQDKLFEGTKLIDNKIYNTSIQELQDGTIQICVNWYERNNKGELCKRVAK